LIEIVDIVSSAIRSKMMSGTQDRNTKPEILVRKALHAQGYRFRLDCKDLLGKPDIVLQKPRAVILVHGCFWHVHRRCKLARIHSTKIEFWTAKLQANAIWGEIVHSRLLALEWHVLTIYERHLQSTSPEVLKSEFARGIQGGEFSENFNALPTVTA